MFAEFINQPIAGTFPEKHFGSISPYSLWVKFTDKDFKEWIGSFAQSYSNYLSTIINLEDQAKSFVIASGSGYMIDILTQQLINDKIIQGISSAIKDSTRQQVIFTNGYKLQTIDITGEVSILSEKYFFDEIELLEVKHDLLFARYWYYQASKQPFSFQLNLITNKILDTYNELSRQE